MNQTLDQQRAAFAWKAATDARQAFRDIKEYRNLTKGAPALIMGNGLMAAIAFYQSRDKAHATRLVNDILGWLAKREGQNGVPPFGASMVAFQQMDARKYMAATEEALAMLRWLRQFADAIAEPGGQST